MKFLGTNPKYMYTQKAASIKLLITKNAPNFTGLNAVLQKLYGTKSLDLHTGKGTPIEGTWKGCRHHSTPYCHNCLVKNHGSAPGLLAFCVFHDYLNYHGAENLFVVTKLIFCTMSIQN